MGCILECFIGNLSFQKGIHIVWVVNFFPSTMSTAVCKKLHLTKFVDVLKYFNPIRIVQANLSYFLVSRIRTRIQETNLIGC